MLTSLNIKSSIHDYVVHFVDDASKTIQQNIGAGDLVIIDSVLTDTFQFSDTVTVISIDASEHQKDFNHLGPIIEKIFASNIRRQNKLVAIGGGITQDITGFISSILMRGIRWDFYPTTLLAQADSCIGGKTSINFGHSKNRLGNFYPPHQIFIDVSLLQTLPNSAVRSGIGEMCHYFLIDGTSSFDVFTRLYPLVLKSDSNALRTLIRHSLSIKKVFIELDEFDTGKRLILNYGHSFGHAIETVSNYTVPHGIAVCFGMDIANFISLGLGFLPERSYDEIHRVLVDIRTDFVLPSFELAEFISALKNDKKNTDNNLNLVLTRGIGEMFLQKIAPDKRFLTRLEQYFLSLS